MHRKARFTLEGKVRSALREAIELLLCVDPSDAFLLVFQRGLSGKTSSQIQKTHGGNTHLAEDPEIA